MNNPVFLGAGTSSLTPRLLQQSFERELDVWEKLNHPRVLPFLGIVTDIGPFICLVSVYRCRVSLFPHDDPYAGFPVAEEREHSKVRAMRPHVSR